MRRTLAAGPLAALAGIAFCVNAASAAPVTGPDSARPVPRYVALKVAGAHGRHGPGPEHKIDWIYQRADLPLQVTAESGPWRRVRDPDGAQVWIHARNLEERRTVYVSASGETALRANPNESARPVAWLSKGVVGAVTACRGDWRRVAVGGRVGWIEQSALWAGEDCTGL
jgi:SH3-like domain-containing protein